MADIINNACVNCDGSVTPVTVINCNNQCCNGLVPVVPSANLKTALMLVNRVFDCVEQTSQVQFRNVLRTFSITSPLPAAGSSDEYVVGDPICINKISLSYTCIGLEFDGLPIPVVDKRPRVFINNATTAIVAGTDGPALCTCTGNPLFNKFAFNLTDPVYCCETPQKNGVQVSLYEPDLDFSVCGLKIVVEGIIGDSTKPFTAEYVAPAPVLLSTLGFKTIDFFEKLCVPTKIDDVVINEEFKTSKFSSTCAVANSNYAAPVGPAKPTFTANVQICFEMKKAIYTMINEKLSVVYDEDGPKCNPYPYPCTDK